MTEIKCHACGVPVHRGSAFEHDGRMYHVPCLVRSLQGEIEVLRECYEALRPHVSDRSVLRGLCGFADVAETEGQTRGEDARIALDWLRQVAGWESKGERAIDDQGRRQASSDDVAVPAAQANMDALLKTAGIADARIIRRRDWDYCGRDAVLIGFQVVGGDRRTSVLMPDVPGDRWIHERCYIDGNSWMWRYAPEMLRKAFGC